MSYEERRQSQFRTVMDIGMGVFYVAIGIYIIVTKGFADMKIPPFIAWLLGSMMALGGGFRFYRGVKMVSGKR